ncbi:TRAP transporter small permease [Roseomonas sp. E05]|uniref:TRAP transporter small permease n=1 Tax=Roseomonas sp. E05 TaxID=3046310 RepID=UPI0024B9B7F7|nr:TRAP transporter small permease [Roseomonas sp. E05]MDJ0389553.1 TRAP transporter small permease [Roseomonas sp. E05]
MSELLLSGTAQPGAGRAARALRIYLQILELLGAASIAMLAVVAALQVFARYVMGASLSWSEELMRYLMVWTVFLLAGLAYSRGEMLGMRFAVEALPASAARVVDAAGRLLIVAFCLLVAWYGWDFADRTSAQQAVAFEVSLFWVHVSVAVGGLLMALHVALHGVLRHLAREGHPEESGL